jgi:hypothetical protein
MLQNQMIVLSGLRSLKIASQDGAPDNEYRIQHNAVEFRSVDGKGISHESMKGQWRVLDPNEIELHFALQTPVAHWLSKNLYSTPAMA